MKKLIRIALFTLLISVFFPMGAMAEERQDAVETTAFDWTPVMHAIIQVESGGNPRAKRGSSLGVMQITPLLVAECNNILRERRSKKRFKLSDRLSARKSKEMFLLFQSKHNPMNNIEQAIRSWNGGLHYSVKRTQRYLERVMSFLNK